MIKKIILFSIILVLVGATLAVSLRQLGQIKGLRIPNIINNENGKPIPINQDISTLIKSGKSLKCEIKSKDDTTLVGGKLYVYAQGYRTELVTRNYDKLLTTFSIVKDNTMYVWTSDKTSGMSLDVTMESSSENKATPDLGMDINSLKDKVTFTCTNWTADTNLFEVPSTIQFMDFTMVIKKLQLDAAADCRRCEQEPTAAGIRECKKELSCKTYESTSSNK